MLIVYSDEFGLTTKSTGKDSSPLFFTIVDLN